MTVPGSGLTPVPHHRLNMHAGTCALPSAEAIISVVQDVQSDADGKLVYVKSYPFAYHIPTVGRVLAVHGDKPGREGTHIACVDLHELEPIRSVGHCRLGKGTVTLPRPPRNGSHQPGLVRPEGDLDSSANPGTDRLGDGY